MSIDKIIEKYTGRKYPGWNEYELQQRIDSLIEFELSFTEIKDIENDLINERNIKNKKRVSFNSNFDIIRIIEREDLSDVDIDVPRKVVPRKIVYTVKPLFKKVGGLYIFT